MWRGQEQLLFSCSELLKEVLKLCRHWAPSGDGRMQGQPHDGRAGDRRTVWGASCPVHHLPSNGWQIGAVGTVGKKAEMAPDLQLLGREVQARFMDTQVTCWSRVYYPSQASGCVFMAFQTILSRRKTIHRDESIERAEPERSSRLSHGLPGMPGAQVSGLGPVQQPGCRRCARSKRKHCSCTD